MAKRLSILAMAVLLMLSGLVQAGEYFVDQKNPAADDKNKGTEAKPLKTISAAVLLVKPGDTIWVKGGEYNESIAIKKSGGANAPITISAWKNDSVKICGGLRDLPPANQWKPIAGSKSWSVVLPEKQPEDMVVVLNGKAMVTEHQDKPPLDSDLDWATYRASDRTLMINADGKNPAEAGKLKLGRLMYGIVITEDYGFWHFKKLEFCHLYSAVTMNCHQSMLEDCYFHDNYRESIFLHGRLNTIRRCNFGQEVYTIGASGSGPSNIIEECLFANNGITGWEQDIRHRQMRYKEGLGPLCFKGDAYGQIFRYNIVADSTGGLWYDGSATGARVIGNCFWDNRHGSGIYNEYSADDTVTIGNYFHHTNFSSSWCTRVNIYDNFFDGGAVTWHNRDLHPLRNSFMTMRGNALINVGNGYLQHFGAGWGNSDYPEGFTNCLVDYNKVRFKPGTVVMHDGKERIKDPQIIRERYGWELHGDIKEAVTPNDLTAESLGATTVTFRLPWGPRSHLARPMLGDGQINGRWPAAPQMGGTVQTPSFFWKLADGDLNENTLLTYEPWFRFEMRWQPSSASGYGQGGKRGCQWLIGAEKKFPKPMEFDNEYTVSERSCGNRYLVMRGVAPDEIPAQGVGYWSPMLATIEGAQINVSLKVRAKDLVPTEKGTVAIWMLFTSATGQNRQRVLLLGKDDAGKIVRPELTKGSYDWSEIKQTITAPKGAIRMALFMGVQPSKGEINFDDIEIKTLDGDPPVISAAAEILPPRLPLERIREIYPIDLSGVANRSLSDHDDNDGKGGWSDQGGTADMRNLKTGERKFGGVPFKILSGENAIVVLKSSSRHPGKLPAKVSIPVGRKLDTLFFVHSCAWTPQEKEVAFRYVLHFKDGKTVEIPVTGENIADWIKEPVKRFPKEEVTFTTVAETVPVERFTQGSVYRMEFNIPTDRRGVEIESIEFVGDGKSVPILVAITGVTEY